MRSDLAEVQLQVGDPAAGAALEAALDASLAVGNLRAAGLVRVRLGVLHGDAPTIARGTLDLWFADRRRAAAALVQLAARLDGDHELRCGPRVGRPGDGGGVGNAPRRRGPGARGSSPREPGGPARRLGGRRCTRSSRTSRRTW